MGWQSALVAGTSFGYVMAAQLLVLLYYFMHTTIASFAYSSNWQYGI